MSGSFREAILAHSGEALASRKAFEGLRAEQRDFVIEFLKTLQVLPQGTSQLIIGDQQQPKAWPRGDDTKVADFSF